METPGVLEDLVAEDLVVAGVLAAVVPEGDDFLSLQIPGPGDN
jgi:hypothetical protein